MAQITTGLRSMLSHPYCYELFQLLMGAKQGRKRFVERFVHGSGAKTILDIGCGPAGYLAYMKNVDYYGYDISTAYIDSARAKYGDKGQFFAKRFDASALPGLPRVDLVIMHGLLHHLDDDEARALLKVSYQALKPGGMVITADGCPVDGQNPLARWLINHDRGQNIRSESAYKALAQPIFTHVESIIEHQKWVPYTLCYLKCHN